MNGWLRGGIAAAALAGAAWVGINIERAGGDVPPPPVQPVTTLSLGHAEGRRIGGKASWSLDYDRMTTTPDSTLATLEHVRHGIIYRHGKPFMLMTAQHVVVNTLTDDFTATGPLHLREIDGQHQRELTSDAANYSGILKTLTLAHPSDVRSDGATLRVARLTIDFHSGDLRLGRIVGAF